MAPRKRGGKFFSSLCCFRPTESNELKYDIAEPAPITTSRLQGIVLYEEYSYTFSLHRTALNDEIFSTTTGLFCPKFS